MKNFLAGVITAVVILLAGGLIYILSGAYDISQLSPDGPVGKWVIEKTMTNSIDRRMKKIEAPELNDSAKIAKGFRHYDEMCVLCHLAPGVEKSEIARGLYPEPPDFTQKGNIPGEREAFWIVQNGIKMTAMPAFSPTHNDEDLWAIIAFLVNSMPELTETDYNSWKELYSNENDEHE